MKVIKERIIITITPPPWPRAGSVLSNNHQEKELYKPNAGVLVSLIYSTHMVRQAGAISLDLQILFGESDCTLNSLIILLIV